MVGRVARSGATVLDWPGHLLYNVRAIDWEIGASMITETPPRAGTVRAIVGTAGVLLCHFISVVILVEITVFVGPRCCYPLWSDWNLQVPQISQWTNMLSHLMNAYWYLMVLAIVPDAIIYFLLARLTYRLNWLATAWGFMVPMVTIVLLGIITTGLCMPFASFPRGQHQPAAVQTVR
jgi:hypothetical protein